MELPYKIISAIESLCKEGDVFLDEGEYDSAYIYYDKALSLVPEPKINWEAATWIYTALGDVRYFTGMYSDSLVFFKNAVCSPGGLGNAYVHLKLGECHFELGNMIEAADELTRAFMSGGEEIFEEEEPRYFLFLRERIVT